jgi:hypothetical protein
MDMSCSPARQKEYAKSVADSRFGPEPSLQERCYMISILALYVPASSCGLLNFILLVWNGSTDIFALVEAVQQARPCIDDFSRVIAPYIEWKRRQSRSSQISFTHLAHMTR